MKSVVQAMAHQGLRQLGAIQKKLTYTQIFSSEYDTSTGTVTTTSVPSTIIGTFGDYKQWEINIGGGKIQQLDRKLLVTPRDFRGIKPKFGDTVTTKEGDVYSIVIDGIVLDPAEALYVMQVRKVSGE